MDRTPSLVTGLESPLAVAQDAGKADRLMVVEGLGPHWFSDYWPSLAIAWLEDGFPIDVEIASLLEAASDNTALSQQVRHKAFALFVAWRRAQSVRGQ
ncbi:hypothetical protein [Achromobacter sp.]|uniref:hypothetical protein n=1 Tax=Achromobacter sp. TaxID=134375 RepID=UPI002898D175|nr:hypothetical protein [Achromobacter sp.]